MINYNSFTEDGLAKERALAEQKLAEYQAKFLERVNGLYKQAKMKKHPYTAPELFPGVASDEIKALIQVVSQELFNLLYTHEMIE